MASILFQSDCNIAGVDKELANLRLLVISSNDLVVMLKSNHKDALRIPLRNITCVEMKIASIEMDKNHRLGGLPHMTLTYVSKESRTTITLWTMSPIWKADYHLRNAIQNALIRPFDLVSEESIFQQFPYLVPKAVSRLSLAQLYHMLENLDTLNPNLLVKSRFWDPAIRLSICECIVSLYKKIYAFCLIRSSEYEIIPVPEETVEEKIMRIKNTPFVYRRNRPREFLSPLLPSPCKSPSNEEFEVALEHLANILLVLNSFLSDIPPNEKGLDAWSNEKTNPVKLMEVLVCVSQLGSSNMVNHYLLSTKAVNMLENIQLRSVKTLWCIYSITRSNTLLQQKLKTKVLSQVITTQTAMLQAGMDLLLQWLGIYCTRQSLMNRAADSPFSNFSPFSTTTKSVPIHQILPPPALASPEMSRPLSAKVLRVVLVLHMAYQYNQKDFCSYFQEELKYLVHYILRNQIEEKEYTNEGRISNWIFSILKVIQ